MKKKITMIATLNKSKTALTINSQEFRWALAKLMQELRSKSLRLKNATQSYSAAEMANEVCQ